MLSQRIREAMQSIHDRIEQLPVSLAMANGSISKDSYVALLEQLLLIHKVLENHYSHPCLAAFISPGVYRTQALERDLATLGGFVAPQPWAITSEMIQHINHVAKEQPLQILGMLYVMEGSRMGSMVLFKPLAKALKIPPTVGNGLDYHIEGIAERPQQWLRFKTAFNSTSWKADEEITLVNATQATMSMLFALYEAASKM